MPVSAAVSLVYSLTWNFNMVTQEGHFLTVYTNRMRPQRSALTKKILLSLNIPRVLSQRSALTKLYISFLNVLHCFPRRPRSLIVGLFETSNASSEVRAGWLEIN